MPCGCHVAAHCADRARDAHAAVSGTLYLVPNLLGSVSPSDVLPARTLLAARSIADPGARVVAAAHRAGVRVVPLVGPSAILLALMAAGMNGQQFAFHGYLPQQADARVSALRALQAKSRAHSPTQFFIQTPYRHVAMLQSMTKVLAPATRLCVAGASTFVIDCNMAT